MFGGADALAVVRNTATLEAERARLRAAQRLAAPFLGAALPLLMIGGGMSGWALMHPSERGLFAIALTALAGAIGLNVAAVLRRAAYLKSHPAKA